MKTSREILLERHRAAETKLDALRREVMAAQLNNQETKEQSQRSSFVTWFLCCSNKFWLELILPSRRIWAGLAAVWVLMIAVNVSLRDHSPGMAMKSAPGAAMILSFQQQEKLLTELMGPSEMRVAQPAQPLVPRPRSEGRFEILMT